MKLSEWRLASNLRAIVIAGLVCLGINTIAGAQQVPIITTYAGGSPIQLHATTTIAQIGIGMPQSIISDRSGGYYFITSQRVYRVLADGSLTLITGTGVDGFGGDGGPANAAQLAYPISLALDKDGNLYIADTSNFRIRKVTPAGIILTVAGNGSFGFSGDGGPARSAQISYVNGIAVDRDGNLLIADSYNNRIRQVTPAGTISTVAGSVIGGFGGDGGSATSAWLAYPRGIAVDENGNIFIADTGNHRVRMVSPAGTISTVAGNGSPGSSGDGGPATLAHLTDPEGVAVDVGGNLFISDSTGSTIRKVTPAGIISTVAGNGTIGFSGDGGPASSAALFSPSSLAVDDAGNLLIADFYNKRIRAVTPAGIIITVAGNGGFGGDGGLATSAQLSYPSGVEVDTDGNVLIADSYNNRIGKVRTDGTIRTFAGIGTGDFSGDGGPAALADLAYPTGVTVDAAGNVFIIDAANGAIRKVDLAGIIRSIAPGHFFYFFDYDGFAPAGEVCVAGITVDAAGNVFVTVPIDQSVWKITPDGNASRVVGDGNEGFSGDGGPAASAHLSFPNGIAIDGDGNLFISDSNNNRIRKVTPAGIISTVVGNGTPGFAGDGGPAASAQLGYPLGLAFHPGGNLFIADADNNRIRMVTPDGTITTVAGNGTPGSGGDGGPAASAQLDYPTGVAIDNSENLFIADYKNGRIRKVSLGSILTLSGVTPNSGGQGKAVDVTLAGRNFDSSLFINAIDGIIVTNLKVVSATSATATFTIAAGALVGKRQVSVMTSAGKSNSSTFTVNPPPVLTSLTPPVGVPGTSIVMTLAGTGFDRGLTMDAGPGVSVSNLSVTSATSATATFMVASTAVLGTRNVTLTTLDGASAPVSFNVVPPFPDLTVSSTHSANFGVGFTESYGLLVSNTGVAPTTGAITATDVLPAGLAFVSGEGSSWSCAAVGQTVTCSSSAALAAGASATLTLKVAVSSVAAPGVIHTVSIATAGDVNPSNDAASDPTTVVATPVPTFILNPTALVPGAQENLRLTLSTAFPHDVTGALTLVFVSSASLASDDPAIQFASGGRQTTFIIPANTLEARFDGNNAAGPVGFQTGTVAGTLSFSGTLQVGTLQTSIAPSAGVASSLIIPKQGPIIQNIGTSNQNGFSVVVSLLSPTLDVAVLILTFDTTPSVALSCGSVAGCTVSGSSMSFYVFPLFDTWFRSNAVFGSLATLHLPFSISGSVRGKVSVRFQNNSGFSNVGSFNLP